MNSQDSSVTQVVNDPDNLLTRYHFMDNLRALALMLGVFFHAAIAYSLYLSEFWVTAMPVKSSVLEFLAFYSHLFRMPLFMLIAGFFACYLLHKRGIKGLIKNRSIRILAPILIFFPLIMAGYVGVFMYALKHSEYRSPLLQLVSTFATNPGARLNMQPSTMHLWFLFNLLYFYVITLIIVKLNLFNFTNWIASRSVFVQRTLIMIVLPLVMIPSFYVQFAPPLHMPDHFVPQFWSFGYYGIYFAVGWVIFSNQQLIDAISNYWKAMLIISLLAFALVYQLYPRTITLMSAINPKGYTPENPMVHLAIAILQGFISVYAVFGLLVLGKKFLDKENAFFRYMSQSSYWVYLVHVPIVLFIQVVMIDLHWNMWLNYFIAVLLTFVFSLLSYQLLVRYTPIGWMLNGRIKPSKSKDE